MDNAYSEWLALSKRDRLEALGDPDCDSSIIESLTDDLRAWGESRDGVCHTEIGYNHGYYEPRVIWRDGVDRGFAPPEFRGIGVRHLAESDLKPVEVGGIRTFFTQAFFFIFLLPVAVICGVVGFLANKVSRKKSG
jgi:hypothetical protein